MMLVFVGIIMITVSTYAGSVVGIAQSIDTSAKLIVISVENAETSLTYSDSTTWPTDDPASLVGSNISVNINDETGQVDSITAR